ncbi:hypothetical protein Tco_0892496 [Tanacetum coccineum]|uniref:Uncharacterized protein n=1 Tax=Tanacetum coccineum TaxID=301880 RepID=A0ABQ5CBF9_9ASTR
MESTLRDMMSNQFRNAKEYAYHLEQSTNYIENQIVWESRQEDIRRSKPRALVFYGPQRNPNEPSRYLYNKDLLFLKNGNTEEKSYILSLHKIHVVPFLEEDLEEKMKRWVKKEFKSFNEEARLSIQLWKDSWHKRLYKINYRRVRANPEEYFSNHRIVEVVRVTTEQQHGSRVIRERVHDFQLGIESYQIRVNLTAPTLIFLGIEAFDPYSIVDKPSTSLIYLNSKNEKRVMYLVEIVKFYDATLERVLNEVKLKIFETVFMKKTLMLGVLDLNIMKAYVREITKRLQHHEQMRRWESFVNGIPILPMMWHQ